MFQCQKVSIFRRGKWGLKLYMNFAVCLFAIFNCQRLDAMRITAKANVVLGAENQYSEKMTTIPGKQALVQGRGRSTSPQMDHTESYNEQSLDTNEHQLVSTAAETQDERSTPNSGEDLKKKNAGLTDHDDNTVDEGGTGSVEQSHLEVVDNGHTEHEKTTGTNTSEGEATTENEDNVVRTDAHPAEGGAHIHADGTIPHADEPASPTSASIKCTDFTTETECTSHKQCFLDREYGLCLTRCDSVTEENCKGHPECFLKTEGEKDVSGSKFHTKTKVKCLNAGILAANEAPEGMHKHGCGHFPNKENCDFIMKKKAEQVAGGGGFIMKYSCQWVVAGGKEMCEDTGLNQKLSDDEKEKVLAVLKEILKKTAAANRLNTSVEELCNVPPDLNGTLTPKTEFYGNGEVAAMNCDKDYVNISASTKFICRNGEWHPRPSCIKEVFIENDMQRSVLRDIQKASAIVSRAKGRD